jgi:hypothetical protein
MRNFDHNIGFWEKRQFFRRKLSKIAENCDHNIDPRKEKLVIPWMMQTYLKTEQCFCTAMTCLLDSIWRSVVLTLFPHKKCRRKVSRDFPFSSSPEFCTLPTSATSRPRSPTSTRRSSSTTPSRTRTQWPHSSTCCSQKSCSTGESSASFCASQNKHYIHTSKLTYITTFLH